MKIKVKSQNDLLRYANMGGRVLVRPAEKQTPPPDVMPLVLAALAAQRASLMAQMRSMLPKQPDISPIEITVNYGRGGLLEKLVASSGSEVLEFTPVRGPKRRIERIAVNKGSKS